MTAKQGEQNDKQDKQQGASGQGGEGGREEPSPIDVQKSLKGIDFPASKDDILSKAREGGASEDVLAELEQIPEREYKTPAEISKELGKLH